MGADWKRVLQCSLILILTCSWLSSALAKTKTKQRRVAQAMVHQPPIGNKKDKTKKVKDDPISGMYGLLNFTASYNLLGARLIGAIGYRKRLYKSSNKILAQNFLGAYAIARITPAWVEGGAVVAFQPITILKFRAAYRYRLQLPAFFSGGVFRTLQDARSTLKDVTSHRAGEDALRSRIAEVQKANNDSRVLPQHHILSADVTFRFKLKGFLLLANARYSKWIANFAEENDFEAFYEGGHDMIFRSNENFFMVEGVTGYEYGSMRYMLFASFRTAMNAGTDYLRLGPAVQWSIASDWGGWFKKPSLLVLVNWYLNHDWRGRDFVPLIGVRLGGEF